VMARARRDKDTVRMETKPFGLHRAIQVYYRDKAEIEHVFSRNGREIGWFLTAPNRLTNEKVFAIQRLYKTRWKGTGITSENASTYASGNLYMEVRRNELFDLVVIFDQTRTDELSASLQKLQQQAVPESAPPPTHYRVATAPVPRAEFNPWQPLPPNPYDQFNPQPVPAAVPQRTPSIENDDRDCLIKAAAKVTELRQSGHWAMILRFDQIKDGQAVQLGGHAVVIFQLKASETLFYWDKDLGSISLGTTSQELGAVAAAVNRLYGAFTESHFGIQNAEWIDS